MRDSLISATTRPGWGRRRSDRLQRPLGAGQRAPLRGKPSRLPILTVLSAADTADFNFLVNALDLTKGNLSSHMDKLETAGLCPGLPDVPRRLTPAARNATLLAEAQMTMTSSLVSAVAVLALAWPMFAGGWFVLSLGNPTVHPDERARASALVIRVYGCAAQTARLEVTAEGIVDGRRRTVALTPVALTPGGTPQGDLRQFDFAIQKSWPGEGAWVLKVVASNGWLSKSALIVLGPNGPDWSHTRLKDVFTNEDVLLALQTLPSLPRA